MAWEYLHVVQENKWIDASEFNRRGEHGWELVSVVTMVVPVYSKTDSSGTTATSISWSSRRDRLTDEEQYGEGHTYHENNFFCIAYFKREIPDYVEPNLYDEDYLTPDLS